jgi:hypothetical protein
MRNAARSSNGDYVKIVIAIVFFIVTCAVSNSEEDPYATLSKFVENGDITLTSVKCNVELIAKFERAKPYYNLYREEWLNKEYGIDFYLQRGKQVFIYFVVKRIAESFTEALYRDESHQDVDRCSFRVKVIANDKFGQDETFTAVTWNFSRDISNRINWQKFDPRSFAEVADSYQISPDAAKWISDEPSLAASAVPLVGSTGSSCDPVYLRANAIFIRATTYCRTDYMDSPAGMYALEKFRQCKGMSEEQLKPMIARSMGELDAVVSKLGPRQACAWVDQLAREILQSIGR